MMRVEDIVSGDERPQAAAKVRRRGSASAFTGRTSRARLLKGAAVTGIGLGLSSLSLFPLAPPALAEQGYEIYPHSTAGPCQSDAFYDANFEPDSSGWQCGPSSVCGTCRGCGCCNTEGFHGCCGNYFNGAIYYLRPDACWGNYDGWNWRSNGGTVYRCHDGTTCWQGGCFPTVCRDTR